ncbi:MAG: DoxX family protein [Actinomycetota bacterium]
MNSVMLIGRILFAFMFVSSGISHLVKADSFVAYATYKKVPAPKISNALAGVVMVLGGLSVILGVYADLGAIVLAALLVIMALKMHAFWTQTDATAKQTEMIGFLKNISMAGGALFIFAVAATKGSSIGSALGHSLWQIAK